MMEKFIMDERTGLKYELVGDYYLIAGENEPVPEPLGIWGQWHRSYLREHKRCIYDGMLMTGKLYTYLQKIDRQAEEMWYGNIEPSVYDTSTCKDALELVCHKEEKLKASLTDAQKELFASYSDSIQELQTVLDCALFQHSFQLIQHSGGICTY